MRLHVAQRITGNLAGLFEPPDDSVKWAAPLSADNFDMKFEALICGDQRATTMQIGSLPSEVSRKLGWRARGVFLSPADVQKIRFHSDHGMSKNQIRRILQTIEQGDYYKRDRGGPLQFEVVLHSSAALGAGYYLALARDQNDEGIFLRTFYFSGHLGRRKMRHAQLLLKQSKSAYFR